MSDNRLIKAYNRLLEHLNEIMDEGLGTLGDAFETAKHKFTDHDLSREELDKVEGSLRRDLEHAAQAKQQDPAHDWSQWLQFDIDLLENFAWDAFMSVADKTRVEIAKLNLETQTNTYFSGEITAPGTYVCDACGKEIAFKSPSMIPDCPGCGGERYHRI